MKDKGSTFLGGSVRHKKSKGYIGYILCGYLIESWCHHNCVVCWILTWLLIVASIGFKQTNVPGWKQMETAASLYRGSPIGGFHQSTINSVLHRFPSVEAASLQSLVCWWTLVLQSRVSELWLQGSTLTTPASTCGGTRGWVKTVIWSDWIQ